MAFCGKCGQQVSEGTGFCPSCGAPMAQAAAAQAGSDTQATSWGITFPGGKKIKPLSIVIAAVVLVVIAVAIFGVTRLFGSAAPPIENVGDRVEFGTWRGKPITWRVLAIEDGRALVISEDILTIRQYDDLGVSSYDQIDWDTVTTTWDESDIRAWLNGEFLDTAFTGGEQKVIDLSRLSNPDNPDFDTKGGKDTEDRVFLLSFGEATRYFSDNDDRIAHITMNEDDFQDILRIYQEYLGYDQEALAEWESILRDEYSGRSAPSSWWLRSPGTNSEHSAAASFATQVGTDGIRSTGYYGFFAEGIRPALWLNL